MSWSMRGVSGTGAHVHASRMLAAALLTAATIAATPARSDDAVETEALELREGRERQVFLRLEDTGSAVATWTLTAPTQGHREDSAGQVRLTSSPASTSPPGPVALRGQFTGRLDSFMLRTYAERPQHGRLSDDTQFDIVVAIDDAVLFDGRVETNAHEVRLGCHESHVAAYTTAFDGIVAAMGARGIAVDDVTVHTLSVIYGPAAPDLLATQPPVRTFVFYGDLAPSWLWANVSDPLTPTQFLS